MILHHIVHVDMHTYIHTCAYSAVYVASRHMSAQVVSVDLESYVARMQRLARPTKSQCVLTLSGLSMVVHASTNHT